MSKGKSVADEEKQEKKLKKKKVEAKQDDKKAKTAKKGTNKSRTSTIKRAVIEDELADEIMIARRVVKQNIETKKILKEEEPKKEPENFEQYYKKQVKPKMEKFAKQHDHHSIASTSMEILFVDIFSDMEKKKYVAEGQLAKYTKPQRQEKVREVKVRREKQGFIGRLLNWKPKIVTEMVPEKYMTEAPSKFKRYVEDNIIVYNISNEKGLELDLEDLTHHMAKEMLEEMGEPDHANEAGRFARPGSFESIETTQHVYENDRETYQEKYEDKIVHSHSPEPIKIEAAPETPELEENVGKKKGNERGQG